MEGESFSSATKIIAITIRRTHVILYEYLINRTRLHLGIESLQCPCAIELCEQMSDGSPSTIVFQQFSACAVAFIVIERNLLIELLTSTDRYIHIHIYVHTTFMRDDL